MFIYIASKKPAGCYFRTTFTKCTLALLVGKGRRENVTTFYHILQHFDITATGDNTS
jgi:predicted cupin superfamily sugar epimerase